MTKYDCFGNPIQRAVTLKLSANAQKAVFLLRGHHVYVERLVKSKYHGWANGFYLGNYTWDRGIFSTRSGMRVPGFSKLTLKELKDKHLLSGPTFFPEVDTRYRNHGWFNKNRRFNGDRVYTLSPKGLTSFIVATVIDAVAAITQDEEMEG